MSTPEFIPNPTRPTGTLLAKIIESSKANPESKVIELSFEQTDLAWRERNNGPDLVIMPEFVLPCLLADLLVVAKVYKVSISEFRG